MLDLRIEESVGGWTTLRRDAVPAIVPDGKTQHGYVNPGF
jgi:hypothetical protein